MKKKLLILVTAIMLALAGCGAKPTLAEWVETEEVTSIEDQLNTLYASAGLRAEFSAEGDDILVFSCIYEQQLDFGSTSKEEIDAAFKPQLEALSSTMTPIFDACESEIGVTLSCIRVQFVNADNTVIYSYDFTK